MVLTGNSDVAEFCRIAQREGLKVIVRPGPYVCSEWDFGGLPWWLLKDPQMQVRTRYPGFMDACHRYFKEVGRELAPLQITKGGPIIMVQVENEYDGYGQDKQYIAALCEVLKEAGFEVPLFSSEMAWSLRKDTSEGLFRAVGSGQNPEKDFQSLRAVQPARPLLCGELYTGWFARWGTSSSWNGGSDRLINTLTWMLDHRASFNLYMAHGGTSFGFASGANSGSYLPELTSYDYGAPINEAGWDTPKFHAILELLAKHLAPGEILPEIPPRNPVIQIPPIELAEVAPLFDNLPKAKETMRPKSMEYFDQPHGCILYRTKLPPGHGERLTIRELRDFASIFVDGEKVGMVERGRKQDSLVLPLRTNETTLDLLIEAMGRINFGEEMHDRKGITEKVELIQNGNPRQLTGWEVFNLPLYDKDLASLKFRKGKTSAPAFYRGHFDLSEVGDTFLHMAQWGKGLMWVNGRSLGRFWSVGPQQTLYCPGPWLKKGANEIIVLELNGGSDLSEQGDSSGTGNPTVAGLSVLILTQVNLAATGRLHRRPDQSFNSGDAKPVHSGSFPPTAGLQTVRFEPARGRYFCLEALNSHPSDNYATCAELDLLGPDGKPLPRDAWKIAYADSEEVSAEDGSAANVFDLRPDTFWHTQWESAGARPPHQLVVDLGRDEVISGMRYLPRQDSPNGRIRDYRLFLVSAIPVAAR